MKEYYKIPKDFTVDQVAEFKEHLYSIISNTSVDLEIDFINCQFIDSTGLGAIVSIFKKINEQKGSLVLTHLNENVKHLFHMTRLDHVMTIKD